MSILHSIAAGIITIGMVLGSFFSGTPSILPEAPQPNDNLGVALPSGTANFESSLATGITDISTSFVLTANAVRGGGSLSGYNCFTIDEGSAQAEFVCGTVSGTSVTSLERGVSPADGVTSVTALKFYHRRGASVKITDFPLIQRLKSQNAGSGTYESVLSYANGVTPAGGSDLVDVEYLTSVVTGTSTLSYNKIIVNGTAGETVATGTIVYLNASDSRWYKADNDLSSTYVDQTLGITQGPGTAGVSISNGVLTYGIDSTQKGMTGGQFIFLSATAGATTTATTSQILGKAISATTMFFDQNLIDSSVYVPTTFTSTTTFTGAVTGIGSTTIRATTTSGIYTKPTSPTFKYVVVEVQGAGGNGATDGASGGGGGYARKVISASELSATTSVTVGTAGLGSGSTSFGSFVSAGNGGNASGDTPGSGGTATTGDLNINGQSGVSTMSGGYGGNNGGNSFLGFGGQIGYNTTNTSVRNGVSGTGYGAGGSGGQQASDSSPSGGSGGSGTVGIVIITEYF